MKKNMMFYLKWIKLISEIDKTNIMVVKRTIAAELQLSVI